MQTKDEDVVTTLFVANTHTQLLFFTTDGMAYKLKTWRLPQGGRTAKGKAIVNILPIPTGVSIAAIMPVDVPEEEWDNLQIIFATSAGDVRRNAEAIDDDAKMLNDAATALSERTENQAATLEESAAAMDEISESVNATATGARDIVAAIGIARETALEGEDVPDDIQALLDSFASKPIFVTNAHRILHGIRAGD